MQLKMTTSVVGCLETYVGINKTCRLSVNKIDPAIKKWI